jgi:hypothetical protein
MIEKDKFSLKEAFNNGEGQTAVALISAFLLVFVGCFCFCWSIYFNKTDFLPYCVSIATIGAGIFGARTIMKK